MVNSEHYSFPDNAADDEIDIADLLIVIWKYRRLIIVLSVVMASLAALLSLTKSRTYTADTTIINMVDNRMIRNVQGFDLETMVQSPRNSILQAILNSTSLAAQVIENAHLLPRLYPRQWDPDTQAWKDIKGGGEPTNDKGAILLKKMVKINSNDNNSTITITVTSSTPDLSALIANAFTKELDIYLKNNTFSSVQKSRIFLENQLAESRKTLEQLKMKMESFQNENGVFDLKKQIDASINAYNTNALLLDQYETEARMTESISSPQNPKVLNLNKYIETIKARMEEIKTGTPHLKGVQNEEGTSTLRDQDNQHYFLPLNRITELKIQMDKFNHDIENQQKIHDLFVDSYEKITIQEAKDKIFVTVLDKADPPLRANGRKTLFKIILAGMMGVFSGVFLSFLIEFYQNHLKHRFTSLSDFPETTREPVGLYFSKEREAKTELNDLT
ncbi:MAG: hypothetical protein KKD44_11570 [Proteobacteria bacterium]|nr:hypothetical protein [Pseudomonadota bacterium]